MTSIRLHANADTQSPRPGPRTAKHPRAAAGVRARWLGYVTLGEAAGFCVPAATGVLLAQLHVAQGLETLLLTAAGFVEGTLLGLGQALAWPVPVRKLRYIALTALGAALAWASVMSVVQLASLPSVPQAAVVAAGVLACAIALAALGSAQWFELRHHVPRAHRFIGWTALAWLLALPLSFAPSPLVDERTPLPTLITAWSVSGLLMAFVMALVTWQGVRRML